MQSIYNNQIVCLFDQRRGLDGRTVGRRAQTGCGRQRGERGRHGAWRTRRAGTSRPGRRTGGQTCKPMAQIEWLVLFNLLYRSNRLILFLVQFHFRFS